MKLLSIATDVPYNGVALAGQKIHAGCIEYWNSRNDIDLRIVGGCDSNNLSKLLFSQLGIKSYIYETDNRKRFKTIKTIGKTMGYVFFPHSKYAYALTHFDKKRILNLLEKIVDEKWIPDVIVFEHVWVALMIEDVKRIFPRSKMVVSTHDVLYEGSKAKLDIENNYLKKMVRRRIVFSKRNAEINALSKFDLIAPLSDIDISTYKTFESLKNLKYYRLCPIFDDYYDVKRKIAGKNIVFYGAMNRKENYISVIWFLENVFNRLPNDYSFTIIGGNPNERLFKYQSNRVKITGYLEIEKVKEYFSSCLCMVVPLLNGSGVKIKILEGFSAGIAVLTNSIGIQGIEARNNHEYIHCTTSEDYLRELLNMEINKSIEIGKNAKLFVRKYYNQKENTKLYTDILFKLSNVE